MKKLDDIFSDNEALPYKFAYEAAQTVVHNYMVKSGKKIGFIAEALDTTENYLYGVLNPKKTEKPLSIDRAIELTDLTNDDTILEEWAKHRGKILVDPKQLSEVQNTTPETLVLALVDKGFTLEEHQGALAKDIRESIKDGVLDEDEKRKLREDAFALMKKATEMLESLK